MKKILLVFSILFVFVYSQTDVFAQAANCRNPATGCIVCWGDGISNTQCLNKNDPSGTNANSCATGYNPPISDLGALCASQDINTCIGQPIYIDCLPKTVPNGGYKCDTSSTGVKSCNPCDFVPNNNIADCPAGSAAPYPDLGACDAACTTATDPGSCTTIDSTATCRTACTATETLITGICPATASKCCLPNSSVGNAGIGTQSVTSVNIQGKCDVNYIDTAIGCVPIGDVNTFAAFFLRWGLGIAGGIGMIFLVYASFMVITSQGDPKRLQVGKELLMSAISGIIMLALSLFIFRILGINILGLF